MPFGVIYYVQTTWTAGAAVVTHFWIRGREIMSAMPIPSALDANTQAFPTLTEVQINRLRPLGKLRPVHPGEILFEPGDSDVPFFVLLSGSMELCNPI
jgi:hypothetical protein